MRIGSESIGRRGIALLSLTAVGSIGLALHGYGQGASTGSSSLSAVAAGPSTSSSSSQSSPRKTSTSTTAAAGNSSTTTTTPKLGPLLSSTQYASLAYKIYPGTPNSKTKLATTGFSIQVKSSGNHEVLSVGLAGSSSPPQTSTIQKGDSVYFVETTLGDDSGNSDYSGGDDGVIVTNPQGRIIE